MTERIHKAKGLESEFLILRNKDVQRDDLSYEAIGMLAYLMSLPPDWKIYVSTLKRKGTGRDAVKRILTELQSKGYLCIEKTHDEKGQFAPNEYHAYAMPEYNPNWQPVTENPSTVNPSTEKQPLQSKEVKKEKNKEIAPKVAKPYYDMIASILDVHGGRNADIQKMLEGKATKKQYEECNLKPPMDLAEFTAWGQWATQALGQYIPKTAANLQSSIISWRQKQSKQSPKLQDVATVIFTHNDLATDGVVKFEKNGK